MSKKEIKQNEFNALYYPYTRFENVDTLKRALLLYDKIYLIYPTEYHENTGISHDENIVGMGEKLYIGDYTSKKLFQVVSPKDIAKEFKDVMLDAYKDDLKDETALRFAPKKDWVIYEEKVPKTILDYPDFEKYIVEGGPYSGHELLKIPFAHGESIMIGQAIFSAQKFNLTLITDDPIHQYFLERRLERGLKLYNSPQYRDEKMELIDLEYRTINEIMERKTVEMIIPSLKDVEINRIVEFREDNNEYLANLRNGIAKLAYKMQSSLRDEELEKEIVRIIGDEIKPMYEKLNKDFRISTRGFIYKMVTNKYAKIASISTPGALVFGAFLSLPLWLGLLTSAGVFLGFEYAKEVLERDKQLKQNYLTYLVKAEKEL